VQAETKRLIPPFTEEHESLRESLRSFVKREIHPHVHEWETAQEFPRELFTRMGGLGFLGLKYPEEYGGQGGDYVHDAVFAE
jgi:alkylation response protein AidB-like acyl-CoA dehydrogenase